ncbi:MAG: serine/threonine-protein kinase, partial [Eubacteriales bacterium]|nr:serine/threonine-protein kinase [Eubacteriales bacterium]
MSDERFKQYEPFFGKWKIGKPLGKGSFGRVYEIYSEDDSGNISRAALKVMHIPTDAALAAQRDEQPDKEAVRSYFLRQVERIQGEIQILQECKGQNNIVNYKEHLIKENPGEEGIGWDILIRMELLYPLSPHLTRKEASQLDIIQMWSDIASALVYCEQQNIMHRDIKPANILLGASGQYKLTDFGVAIRNATREEASTRVGTERYMAPEVYRNQSYDKRVDCYSLGCVIYYFLNRRRHVFMPHFPRQTTAEDSEQAERRRINGDEIPPIPWVPNEVNRILRKSMAYRPENRYQHAIELYNDLQYLMKTEGQELRKRPLMFMKKQRGTVSTPKASEKKQTVPVAGEKKDFGRPNLQKEAFGRP